MTCPGYPIGSLLAVPIMARLERRVLVVGSAALMDCVGLGLGLSGRTETVMGFGLLDTVVSNVFRTADHVCLPESYPTTIRGSAAGAA